MDDFPLLRRFEAAGVGLQKAGRFVLADVFADGSPEN